MHDLKTLALISTCMLGMASCNLNFDSPGDKGTGSSTPPVSGLEQRPSNTRCVAGKRPALSGNVALQRVFTNLSFSQPVALTQAPGSSNRWYVVEKPGSVISFANDNAATQKSTFIDLQAKVDDRSEGGLLGIAFHPDYATNGYVFLSYTTSNNDNSNFRSVISRFTANASHTALETSSELVLMTVAQPYGNHNGGNIAFGPDGFLYIGFGDGGSGGDPEEHGQDTRTLLGTMLRVDVNVSGTDLTAGTRYKIPAGNPFTGAPTCSNGSCPNQAYKATAVRCAGSGCPEIFAWGLRNPWRWSFDRLTGDLWVADVGQNAWEEVDLLQVGKNYGWRCYEGTHDYNSAACGAPGNYTMPVNEYDRNLGTSITGGYVYRGAAIPALAGTYVFADFGSGRVFGLNDPKGAATRAEIAVPLEGIASFAQDNDGELYAVNLYSGELLKIVPGTSTGSAAFPAKLSDTGCADDADLKKGSSGMIPFDVNAALWSDGATKKRWLALPDSTAIDVDSDGDFQFPAGSVLRKNFYLSDQIIETRLLAYHTDGDWAGYSYQWDDTQSDATLVTAGAEKMFGTQQWIYPSGADCMRCHSPVAGRSLGPEIAQLNRDFSFESGKTANQLFTYASIDLLGAALSETPAQLPKMATPAETTASLAARARAYLHANCSHCHRPDGPGRGSADFRYDVSLALAGMCNADPVAGDLGVTGAKLVVPGNSALSLVSLRMHAVSSARMPPLASSLVDASGTELIDAWINSLSSCT